MSYGGHGGIATRHDQLAVTDRVTGAVHTPRSTTVFDADGNVASQLVADSTGGDASRTVSTAYDSHDRPATVTDAAGAGTTYGYGPHGDLTEQVDPAGTEVDYGHDGASPNVKPNAAASPAASSLAPSPAISPAKSTSASTRSWSRPDGS